jgi:hypothetical protein
MIFPVVRTGMELILDARIAEAERAEKEERSTALALEKVP